MINDPTLFESHVNLLRSLLGLCPFPLETDVNSIPRELYGALQAQSFLPLVQKTTIQRLDFDVKIYLLSCSNIQSI